MIDKIIDVMFFVSIFVFFVMLITIALMSLEDSMPRCPPDTSPSGKDRCVGYVEIDLSPLYLPPPPKRQFR